MVDFKLKITNPNGLTARLAAELVEEANKYESDITLETKDDKCNLKSIMNVFGTEVNKDDVVTITASGIDEDKVESGFNVIFKAFNF